MADRATNPERLVGADRRDVQPLITFEATGEGDAHDRCGGDVTEHLIGAESRSECPSTFVHGFRGERGPDAVERSDEVACVEATTRDPAVQRVPHPEGSVTECHREPASGGHLHIVAAS